MSQARIWVLGVVAAMLVVVIGGWTLGISPIVTQITEADSQTTTIQSSNAASQAQLATLKSQFAGITQLQTNLDTLRLSIPEQQAASTFLDEVNSLSSSAGTQLESVQMSDALLYSAPSTAATGAATTTSTPAPTASPTPTTPTTPVVTASGLVLIPVVVIVKGTLGDDQSFFGALQTGSRLFVSSNLVISTDPSSGAVLATITGDIFTLQGSSDSTSGGSTPTDNSTSTPTPTATATPTATPTPTPTSSTSSKTSGSGSGSSTGTGSGSTTGGPATKPTHTPNPNPTS
jgi:hypothetical protein